MTGKPVWIFILLCTLATSSLFAMEYVSLTDSIGKYPLGRFLEILEDKDGDLTIRDVTSPELSNRFIKSKWETPNYGYTDSVFWVRFGLKNDRSGGDWLLEVDYPLTDRIELYIPSASEAGFTVKKAGDQYPFHEREFKHQNIIFPLPSDMSEESILYLRFESEGTMQMPLNIWSPLAFLEKDHKERLLFGLYYGIILALFLYNLFLFFSLRDVNYLYYVLFIASYGFMQISLTGLAYEYLWPDMPWWSNKAIPLSIAFSVICVSKFSSSFLQARTHVPKINHLFNALMVSAGLVMIFSLVGDYTLATTFAAGLTMVFILVAMTAGIISWSKGYRLAKFFVIAWSIFMIGQFLYILQAFGVLPQNGVTVNGMYIGSAMELILLSLALADRINIIREEKEDAQTLAIENLHTADKMKDEFLANTTHELKTPLNGIIGIAESVMSGSTGEISTAQRTHLNMILTSGNRLLHLVNDILDSSQLTHHDISLQLESVDMKQIVDLVLRLSEPLIKERPIELCNDIPDKLPPVLGDVNRLQQIVHNLVGNAVKFTEKGRITVSASEIGNQMVLTVSDTGIGIPEEKQVSIFESFIQADASTSRRYGGTGLGLSITKQLVELHGGSIRVVSDPDIGSRFIFTLPLSRDPVAELEKSRLVGLSIHDEMVNRESLPVPAGVGAGTILAVDDDPINLQVVIDFLSLDGYRTEKALSGSEALAAVEMGDFDLVLLDLMMPGLSGLDVCRRIRERHSATELPVIMLTAKNRISDLIDGFDVGANDFLTKPILRGELLARVNTHVKMVRMNRKMENLQKEVSRIAMKIHNSLKNKLESIRNFLLLSIRHREDGDKQLENLTIAGKIIDHCSNESKNILFVLTNKECRIREFLDEMELQAELAFSGDQAEYMIRKDNLPEEEILNPEVVQNLLDLYTEVLNNIVKHSEATAVDIDVLFAENQLTLRVKDNGIGFDYNLEKKKKGSYGLKLLDELNKDLGGGLSINSRPGEGAQIEMIVQLYQIGDKTPV